LWRPAHPTQQRRGIAPTDETLVETPMEEFSQSIRLDLFGTFLDCQFRILAIIASGRRIGDQHRV
jgi:hypothetical protein